jgi:zinc transport system substrate-binding protein
VSRGWHSRVAAGWAIALVLAASAAEAGAPSPGPLRVGITLHPYYSWTANVVRDCGVELVPILPGEVDAGDYQPRMEDIAKIVGLDAVVVNGVGHDDFIFDMIRASGNRTLRVIRPNNGVPLLKAVHGGTVNSHTFISFSNAIQQTYGIARALADLRPALASRFDANAAEYARRLRAIKATAARQLADAPVTRVVTVHDGYGYLMQEFGIEIAGVVEPAHGLLPSAKELGAVIDLLRREHIQVVFSEASFPAPLLQVLRDEGHARVYVLSHVASGAYTPDKFEIEMQKNADTLVQALVTDPRG